MCRLDQISKELDRCREDERSSQNQILQTIATAGTILSVICGATFLRSNEAEPENMWILLLLSDVIFCVTIAYIVSLGIGNVMRFHYIQALEDEIYETAFIPKDKPPFVHWISFNSSINTKNPKHLKSVYSVMSYLYYTTAVALAIAFCLKRRSSEWRITWEAFF